MSDNYNLIIKNGSCYIDGKLIKSDIGLSEGKIKKIGKIKLNNSKFYKTFGQSFDREEKMRESTKIVTKEVDNEKSRKETEKNSCPVNNSTNLSTWNKEFKQSTIESKMIFLIVVMQASSQNFHHGVCCVACAFYCARTMNTST